MMLTKEQILSAKDFRVKEINVPEWGGKVCIKVMSGKERDDWEEAVQKKQNKDGLISMKNMRALLVSKTLCDKQGNLLFDASDIEKLGEKNGAVLDKLFAEATDFNAVTEGDIEELKKNS